MKLGRAQVLALAVGGCLFARGGQRRRLGLAGRSLRRDDHEEHDAEGRSRRLSRRRVSVVGADGITIDLGGHTISGTNADGGEGIANDGHAGVQIRNGKITGFRLNGVGIRGAHDSVVRTLVIRRIGAGGVEGDAVPPPGSSSRTRRAARSWRTTCRTTSRPTSRMASSCSARGAAPCSATGSMTTPGTASRCSSPPGSRIAGNELTATATTACEVNGGSDSTWVVGNSADGNTNLGIVVGSASGARVTGNSATGSETGLFFFDLHDSVISANRASGNAEGLVLFGGQFGSTGNRVTANVASRNLFAGIGIAEGANDNIINGNVANENQGPIGEGGGIYVVASSGNQLISNTANGNFDSGIGLFENESGDTTGNSLKGNTANKNRNHGIDAVTGTTDGGGNRAAGNAVQPQCVNVVCSWKL